MITINQEITGFTATVDTTTTLTLVWVDAGAAAQDQYSFYGARQLADISSASLAGTSTLVSVSSGSGSSSLAGTSTLKHALV